MATANMDLIRQTEAYLRSPARLQRLQALIPANAALDTEIIIQSALIAMHENPLLLDCTNESKAAAIYVVTQWGLLAGKAYGQVALIPYAKVCTPQLMYQGMETQVRRNGGVVSISARAVYKGDTFEEEYGLNERLVHVPCGEESDDDLIAVYCVMTFADGRKQFEVVRRKALDKIKTGQMARLKGQGRDTGASPWTQFFSEQCKKVAIKRLAKHIPKTRELATALAMDNALESGVKAENVLEGDYDEVADKPTATERLETKLTGPEPATPRRGRPPKASPTTPKPAQDERKPAEAYQDSPPATKSPETPSQPANNEALEPLRARIRDLAAEKPERFEAVLENLFGLPEIQLQNLDEAELNSIIVEMDAGR